MSDVTDGALRRLVPVTPGADVADGVTRDEAAIARATSALVLATVRLQQLKFEVLDPAVPPERDELAARLVPEFVQVELRVEPASSAGETVTVSLGTRHAHKAPIFEAQARYWLRYGGHAELRGDLEQFVLWKSVEDVWPYWRALLAQKVAEADLPAFALAPARQRPNS